MTNRFNPDLAAEGARLVEAAAGPGTRAAVAHWLETDARRQQQANRALRIVEALCRANATYQALENEIDAWVAKEVSFSPTGVPDFWDECNTSARLAEYLVRVGWRKVAAP